MNLKSSFLLIIVFSLITTSLIGQDKLQEADSLFQNGKYTQAFDIYEEILNERGASQAMLLRMAFIKEGLQDYAKALLFLNLYYDMSGDRKTWNKIEELANKNELAGYSFSDKDFFLTMISKYRGIILTVLILFSIGLAYHLYHKRKHGEVPGLTIFFQVLTLSLFIFVANDFFVPATGIVIEDETLLMSGPSAAGEPIETIEKGHKVPLLEETDIWTKILWEGEEVFLRKSKIVRL